MGIDDDKAVDGVAGKVTSAVAMLPLIRRAGVVRGIEEEPARMLVAVGSWAFPFP